MIKKRVVLIPVMFFLVLPIVLSVTDFTESMKSCWNMDGDATDDYSTWDGVVDGATAHNTYDGVLGGGAYSFDGDDFIAIGGDDTNFNFYNNFSMLICFNITDDVSSQRLIGSGNDRWRIYKADDNYIALLDLGGATLDINQKSQGDGNLNHRVKPYCVVITFDTDTSTGDIYIDGVANSTRVGGLEDTDTQIWFGKGVGGDQIQDGWIGISAYWENRTLTAAEITELETNLRAGETCPTLAGAAPPEETFTVTAKDLYSGVAINEFSVNISNSTAGYVNSTSSGSLVFGGLNGLYYIKLSSNETGGYFNISYIDWNVTSDLEGKLYQAILYVNVSEVITENKISTFTTATSLQSNTSNATGWGKLVLSAGRYNISANSSGYLAGWQELNVTALTESYTTVNLGSANLTITANSIITGNTISNFSINLTHMALNYKDNKSTNNGTVLFKTIAATYNLTITAEDYATASEVITIQTTDHFPNVTFSLYTQNSINITVYDEDTQEVINETITIVFDHTVSKETVVISEGGNLYKDDLNDGLYDLAASAYDYYQRHYFITITPFSHNTLNIWLLNTSEGAIVTFTIKNQLDQPIENAFMTVTSKVNESHVVVEQKYSDFAGQVKTFLKSTTKYRFLLDADGYTTKTFDLEPSSTTYNIIMTSTSEIPFETIYDKLSYLILPTASIVNASEILNFSIITSSEGGYISYFGLNSSWNGISRLTNVSGSVGGGTASIIYNLSNSSGSTVSIDHFIKLSDEALIIIHKSYYTTANWTGGNYSAMSIANKYSGKFTAVMKAVIAVFVAIAIIATFAELGVPAAISGVVGAMIMIVFSIIGWLPRLMIGVIVIITIGMFVVRRGD